MYEFTRLGMQDVDSGAKDFRSRLRLCMREDVGPVEHYDEEVSYSTEVFALSDKPGTCLVPSCVRVGKSVRRWERVNVLERFLVDLEDIGCCSRI
jgi:hypothetical protein